VGSEKKRRRAARLAVTGVSVGVLAVIAAVAGAGRLLEWLRTPASHDDEEYPGEQSDEVA